MSRKCRAIAAYKRANPNHAAFILAHRPWPIRQDIAPPYAPEPGMCWHRKLSPCEWRRFYRRNPMALYIAQRATRDPLSAQELYTRHLKRLNMLPEFGPMNRAPL